MTPTPFWLEHCPPPRARLDGIEWDVFISYRSINRRWAMSLYDMLQQADYKVFLDQYVLKVGGGLSSQLGQALEASASGVLLWSKDTGDSEWVESEYNLMESRRANTAKSEFPFHFAVATLDDKKPPGLTQGRLWVDFSKYPDGPTGAELVRLLFGLRGEPLDPPAVRKIFEAEEEVRDEPARLRADASANDYAAIHQRALSDARAYVDSAALPALAAEILVAGKQDKLALEVLDDAAKRFPKSIRLNQLKGLALRRTGDVPAAIKELARLRHQGNRDPETMGTLGACWADEWESRMKAGKHRDARDALEQSRNLYLEAWELSPSNTYVGINAASKSVLLGQHDKGKPIAESVLQTLEKVKPWPPDDYWVRATKPEALLILGRYEESLAQYHDARIAHQNEKGSIESTAKQLDRLLNAIPELEPAWATKFRDEFGLPQP